MESRLGAWAISRHITELNKKRRKPKKRRNENILRSRVPKENDFKYNPENYRGQIDIEKVFGLRRESILGGDYEVKECSFFYRK